MHKRILFSLWLSSLCFALLMCLPSAALAAEQIVEADGEYLVGMGLEENFSKARERAEADAMANAAKQMAVYVEAITEVKNHQLTASEVRTLTAKVMGQVKPSTFNNVGEGDVIRIRCHVVVRVKDDDVLAALQSNRQELKESLRREQEKDEKIAELNRQMEELNQKYLAAKTDGERAIIQQQAKANDASFTAAQLVDKAFRAYEAKDYTKATAYCLASIELDQNYSMAYFVLGNTFGKLKDYNNAIEQYNKLITLEPKDGLAYYNLGRIYKDKGEYDKAIECYNMAITLYPWYVNPYNDLGIAYRKKGEYNKAIECYNKSIAMAPEYVFPYNNLGNIYRELGDTKKAIELYSKAVAIDIKYARAYYNLGLAYSDIGEYQKAIECYNKFIALVPEDADAYGDLGFVYVRKGDYNTAIEYYNKAIALNPKCSWAYNDRGKCYEHLGNRKAAKRDFAKACELDPNVEIYRKNKRRSENW